MPNKSRKSFVTTNLINPLAQVITDGKPGALFPAEGDFVLLDQLGDVLESHGRLMEFDSMVLRQEGLMPEVPHLICVLMGTSVVCVRLSMGLRWGPA